MLTRRELIQSGVAAALSRLGVIREAIASTPNTAADKAGGSMVKVVAPAQRHSTNRTLAQFQNYWAESHGPLFANTENLRRYVQHITLTEAYGIDPAPSFDGVSMFWFDGWEAFTAPKTDPELSRLMDAVAGVPLKEVPTAKAPSPSPAATNPREVALIRAVLKDDAQLFDRSTSWPMHKKRASVWAREQVIVDGPTRPDMVKAIFIATKLPGLTLGEFFDHWQNHHGPLGAKVPGVRRYVQNHALPEAYIDGSQTHDGWSEVWFDDLAALHQAVKSPEWRTLGEDGATLFATPMGIGVARERIQKDLNWKYQDWGVNAMSVEDVRQRLRRQRYEALATDATAPRKIKAAAAKQALAVWTDEHLVTIDDSAIDARPQR
jgi:uncharacterized protein (TIGR02118 family)